MCCMTIIFVEFTNKEPSLRDKNDDIAINTMATTIR